MEKDILWQDRKRFWCKLPTFTLYSLDEDKLYIDSGFFTTKSDEVRLYRILDISLTRTLIQKILGLGTISIVSSDKTMKNFELKNIKNSKETKEMLSDLVERARNSKKVSVREFAAEDDDMEDEN